MYKNVALISLPKQDLIRPPGALAILASACEEFSINYEVYDFNLWLNKHVSAELWNSINDNWESVNPFEQSTQPWYQEFIKQLKLYVDQIEQHNYDLISISIFSDLSAYCAAEFIKEINCRTFRNNTAIVIGGSGIRAQLPKYKEQDLCQAMLSEKLIDYYIFGEGELSFRSLLRKQVDYPGINNYNAEQIEDLDQFPWPSYKKINPHNYRYVAHPEIVITGSRGCVRKCTYCDVARYWPKFRFRSGENIAAEMYHYYKTLGITNFEFSDSLINGSLKQFKAMIRSLLEYQQKDPNFKISYKGQYICRQSSHMNSQDYHDLKQSGCDYLYVGVESFSQRTRFEMDKKFTNEDLDFHLEMCGRVGIKNSLLMMVGYPTETAEDHDQNIVWLKNNQKYAQSGTIAMIVFGYTTSILEDTPLFHLTDQLSIVPEFDTAEGFESANWISLNNPGLTLKERIRRWTSLTELATELGYSMPRNRHYIMRFIMILKSIKHKRPAYRIQVQ
jgi:hypothetical protein